jgi:ABC-type sugar transport system ATPase subunit
LAEIELRDVSLTFSAPPQPVAFRLYEVRKEQMQEDLPVKTAAGVKALEHVNLIVPDGQTYVVVGPSGCGKSSLLRVVAGLNNDFTGQVLYDGVEVMDIHPKERYIGMVFQNYALYPNFKNEGNLSFFFKLHKISDEKTRERIRYTSELMGIGFDELLPRKPGTLSGGQKQRVAIARAIVRQPRLFLFDEPLSNLDAKLRMQTRTEIKRLLHRFGITGIYVTHDQTEAMALADQIVIMRSGKIEQVGTYQDLMQNPVNEFVAGFLGLPPMNLLPGGVISGSRLMLDDFSIPLSKRVLPLVRDDQAVTLGMRQEAVNISVGNVPFKGIQLAGQVEAIEPDVVHHIQLVHFRSGRWTFSGFSPLDLALEMGQPVQAQIDPERLYFFDTNSGLRLG